MITNVDSALYRLTANTIRALAMDAVQQANSGHPGMPMGMADVATVLWSRYLKFDPQHPDWPDRDRFVLSAGHGSMLLYALLHLSGFDLPMQELENFRQWDSRTPGHPEYCHTPGVETTTGPLGQGLSNAVGMALAERWLAARFNRPNFHIVNHRTYVIASDGDLMEGISHEVCALAGHLGLGRLVVFYDDNHITIDGPTSLSYSDDVLGRFRSYGWQVEQVDGHDTNQVADALDEALDDESRPSLIACRTTIGYGSPNRAGTAKAHGEPLGVEEVALTKSALQWTHEPFAVPDRARTPLVEAGRLGSHVRQEWQDLLDKYQQNFPDLAAEFSRAMAGELPVGWESVSPDFSGVSAIATRAASGQTLAELLSNYPDLLGGSADLTGSNNTKVASTEIIKKGNYGGRYIHYGVREHGMSGIMNGLALHGGVRPYGGTFLVFSDYLRPTIRLAAMMKLAVIYVFTHDSIGLGEDGPTHQPVEHLAALRAIPNLVLIRPADAWETAAAWKAAVERRSGPTALVLTRQKLPLLSADRADELAKGAYVLTDMPDPQAILISSGSEVQIAAAAQKQLQQQGIATRLVSMPSWELFQAMPQTYRDAVLPPGIKARVAVEAGQKLGWERYVGDAGMIIGLERFGASAPYQTIYEKLGITDSAVVDAVTQLLGQA